MSIVTFAGTGSHVAGWRSHTVAMPLRGVVVCEQQVSEPLSSRLRQRDLLPTDPQRTSAPRRWGP
ncbi:hypothetical protein [Actinomycetospora cinnamomea]|uniref:Uncharacterized protein n=1 Tax=Actinomycetospora cinnamomea TaxID=663609 RepID=A0A2U1F8I9_9PSEU|nr:hypothetical protein [Actinomycetospora cinnamomea]PVZ08491.1 hypothetical protein C8D89_10888 [Actinomycetospora cinnamomea]